MKVVKTLTKMLMPWSTGVSKRVVLRFVISSFSQGTKFTIFISNDYLQGSRDQLKLAFEAAAI